jgi:L-cysteine:1D-myo-inositol 2-amino-2-deoxy-alpha-D-glucopyranoside ligase
VIPWPAPFVPRVPGTGPRLRLHDTSTQGLREVAPEGGPGEPFTMYVCGITPYDATHLGHAATYVTFDLVQRAVRDAGHRVRYVQNVTDVDDPLFERADRDGVDFRALAAQEVALFREDMSALAVLPPDAYIGVEESMQGIVTKIEALLDAGQAYRLPIEGRDGQDVYLDLATEPEFGSVSGWTREQMLEVFAERGGDPDRPGKRDALDPLLWRAARPGDPTWEGRSLGPGRPGWHIECTAITIDHLGMPFDLKGGGTDLVFPHHEMSAAQAYGLGGGTVFARHYAHQAMVGYQGEKMSKSKGNLVLVSALRAAGVDPMAIRLVLLAQHYRRDWEYTPDHLVDAQERLALWREALSGNVAARAEATVEAVRTHLADDLDSAGALAAVDAWAHETLALAGRARGSDAHDGSASHAGVMARALDALLGLRV